METNLVSMAQQFSGLPMESLIGGPLNAAAKANSAMALSQTKFMLDTCFQKVVKGENTSYNPIMIKMALTRGVMSSKDDGTVEIKPLTTQFDLPLLTVMPLNSLAVDNVSVNFEMEVKSSFSEDDNKEKESSFSGESSFETKLGWGLLSVSIKGNASYSSRDSETHNTHYEKSNSAKYTVNVHAGQLPLPKGVNTIIEAFSKAIEPIQVEGTKSA
ncbi:DUF2589 domain-containing protein [Bacteroides uniformis]|uniref:DUF2589 domain-containing protein n=1 Tax=Bacteroides uniformis TaxID=820 RepID=A0AAW6GVZ2_BACUN|nr:DUF2589 domain-containing protein [Bacteroides uniformis]MDC1882078.1 DUF2589 domain-containing protein [Bacteroides uniformis]MDC1886021.1 DUF2589 domain-containing protein [Bacteroides uniformis]